MTTMAEILGPGGIISRRLPGYEARPSQIAMAEAVATALTTGQHAVIEGGTGVGKSLAYLIPAIYSGKRVVVSTANKALQDQLVGKDIPFLQHVLPREVTAALVKGRSNYLCLDRFNEEEHYQIMSGTSLDFRRLKTWAAATRNGDLEEMEIVPARDLRSRVVSTSRTCIGNACEYINDCFIEKMRARAEDAQIVVCNHALLLADLVIRDLGGSLMPDRDAVIIDEAHRLEDAALSALTASLSRREIMELVESVPLRRQVGEAGLATLPTLADSLFGPFEVPPALSLYGRPVGNDPGARPPGSWRIEHQLEAGLRLAETLERISETLTRNDPYRNLQTATKESRHYERLIEWVTHLAENARLVSRPHDADSVRYVERFTAGGTRTPEVVLKWTPTDVSAPLAELLFRHTPVICTSATLAVGDFTFFRRAVGIDHLPIDAAPVEEKTPARVVNLARVREEKARLTTAEPSRVVELVAASPFDYPEQALLYVPSHLPEFRSSATPEYTAALCAETERLVRLSQGRAFLLFTSYRGMDDTYRLLSERLPFTVLKQGDASRSELLRQFRADGQAVLFATKSFWEGIDVVGSALSLVVIDRMPFTVPDDPVVATRVERMKREGQDWFNDLMLPNATLQLKQGFGRLIRSRRDRGVVAILDSRLIRKSYGVRVLRALPPARQVRQIEEVERFFAQERDPLL